MFSSFTVQETPTGSCAMLPAGACVPGMGVIYQVEVLSGEGSSSRSLRQGCPWQRGI